MIPARMGSQRLTRKNLRELGGIPLITHAIRKSKESAQFDDIWVNSENVAFGEIAEQEGVEFYQRPEALGNNAATSEDFVGDFLRNVECDFLVQVHSIAPLLSQEEITNFVQTLRTDAYDVMMSVVEEQIECAFQDRPVNFTYQEKTNSQDLKPLQRITWSITAWRARKFLEAQNSGGCATYAGRVGYWPVSRAAGHIIKTQEDLDYAEALYNNLEL